MGPEPVLVRACRLWFSICRRKCSSGWLRPFPCRHSRSGLPLMASDSEEDALDDADAICGWGAADFDDELSGRGRRQAPATKRKPRKAASGLDKQPLDQLPPTKQQGSTFESPVRRPQVAGVSTQRKVAPKQREKAREPQDVQSPKPSPRTLLVRDGNAAIAALGRERRMRIVAATMAANAPRKSTLGSVVSASFDADSDDEQEEVDATSRRRADNWVPSSAPENQQQQEKLPRVTEPWTAPAGPAEAAKMIHPPLLLPLLSIKPDCGGNDTRLTGKDAPPSGVPRHWRRRRRQQPSLLPSRDASEHWESSFPPALRRARSPRKYQAELPSSTTSSFTRAVRVPLAPRQDNPPVKEHLPLIHRNRKKIEPATDVLAHTVKVSDSVVAPSDDQVAQRGWTRCYDDPDVVASSMAGLIQALSTFAAGGKHAKSSKAGKNKRRRAKLHLQQVQQVPPTVVRCPPPGDISVTSGRAPMATAQ